VERIEGAVGITKDGEESAVYACEFLPVKLFPALVRDRRRHH
jgi:hypothetical protein